ncbi:MAG: lipocalin-like domain-containing protein [Candidatus Bathyarchaeota archaeon]
MTSLDDFIGTWKLVSVETRREDGSLHRKGTRTGYIIYSADGYMSVAFMKEGRKVFAAGDIRGGTVEEKVEAIDGYVSYCGKYEVAEDRVIHDIEVSLFPNWVGDKQERFYRFEGDTLTLSTPLQLVGGINLSSHLVWEKV